MPTHKPWDHGINLKDSFIPLFYDEQAEVSTWLDDQLQKGYIHSSKYPTTSLVFFAPKQDRRKCMVQDYYCINEHTVCNNYLLPLILQWIDRLKEAKLFTTLDL